MAIQTPGSSDGSLGEEVVSLTVPAQADVLHVLRTVVASVAARLDFDFDQIEDLRLATSEAITHLLEEPPAPPSLVLRITENHGVLEIVAARTLAAETWPPIGTRRSLTSLILRALVDEATFVDVEEGPAIKLVKRGRSASDV